MSKIKMLPLLASGLIVLNAVFLTGCGSSEPEGEWVTEEVTVPTQGLVTTVKEVEKDKFLIDDETTVATPEESRIVANYMDGKSDTFTLDEAKIVAADSTSGHRRSPIVRAATAGLFGFFMGRAMGGMSPGPMMGAYTSPDTYNRVNNTAGQTLNNTATRTTVTRPAAGKSGFGGGRSTRSVGG